MSERRDFYLNVSFHTLRSKHLVDVHFWLLEHSWECTFLAPAVSVSLNNNPSSAPCMSHHSHMRAATTSSKAAAKKAMNNSFPSSAIGTIWRGENSLQNNQRWPMSHAWVTVITFCFSIQSSGSKNRNTEQKSPKWPGTGNRNTDREWLLFSYLVNR